MIRIREPSPREDVVMCKSNLVPAVERTFRIMELVGTSKKGYSLSDISRRLQMPKSSAHLILLSLELMGYLQKDPRKGTYRLGLKLMSLSRAVLENVDLCDAARPAMQKLANGTALTVHLAALERGEAVILEKIEVSGATPTATWVGRRLGVNCTGVGKALIAFLAEEEFDKVVKQSNLPKHNENSIVSIKLLKRRLDEVRSAGFALDDEEDEIGVRCIGAPVFDGNQRPIAAISVSGPLSSIPLERVSPIAMRVMRAAAAINFNLGYVARP